MANIIGCLIPIAAFVIGLTITHYIGILVLKRKYRSRHTRRER